jgi:hypothetical protein
LVDTGAKGTSAVETHDVDADGGEGREEDRVRARSARGGVKVYPPIIKTSSCFAEEAKIHDLMKSASKISPARLNPSTASKGEERYRYPPLTTLMEPPPELAPDSVVIKGVPRRLPRRPDEGGGGTGREVVAVVVAVAVAVGGGGGGGGDERIAVTLEVLFGGGA